MSHLFVFFGLLDGSAYLSEFIHLVKILHLCYWAVLSDQRCLTKQGSSRLCALCQIHRGYHTNGIGLAVITKGVLSNLLISKYVMVSIGPFGGMKSAVSGHVSCQEVWGKGV